MSEGEHDNQPEAEADTLIGRIIDREATSDDCETFERMASVDPILWRALALPPWNLELCACSVAGVTGTRRSAVDRLSPRAGRAPVEACRRQAGRRDLLSAALPRSR